MIEITPPVWHLTCLTLLTTTRRRNVARSACRICFAASMCRQIGRVIPPRVRPSGRKDAAEDGADGRARVGIQGSPPNVLCSAESCCHGHWRA